MEIRELTLNEQTLVKFLNSQVDLIIKFPSHTKTMKDGGMGSITCDLDGSRTRKIDLTEAHYVDSDDQLVIITLTLNEHDELYELDFWKTDFSKLKTYPTPEKIKIIHSH